MSKNTEVLFQPLTLELKTDGPQPTYLVDKQPTILIREGLITQNCIGVLQKVRTEALKYVASADELFAFVESKFLFGGCAVQPGNYTVTRGERVNTSVAYKGAFEELAKMAELTDAQKESLLKKHTSSTPSAKMVVDGKPLSLIKSK